MRNGVQSNATTAEGISKMLVHRGGSGRVTNLYPMFVKPDVWQAGISQINPLFRGKQSTTERECANDECPLRKPV